MQSYKDFKKGYLNEWVDRSQAARKAAEELAKKDTTSLRDKYSYDAQNPDLVFTLDGHEVEFKAKNEEKSNGIPYFSYDQAIACQKDGWRLPTAKELRALCEYPRKFENKEYIIDNRLKLPAEGFRDCDCHGLNFVGYFGRYWSLDPDEDFEYANFLELGDDGYAGVRSSFKCKGHSVRLVRDVK